MRFDYEPSELRNKERVSMLQSTVSDPFTSFLLVEEKYYSISAFFEGII